MVSSLEQVHTKNEAILLHKVARTLLGTNEHSRVHFPILAPSVRFRALHTYITLNLKPSTLITSYVIVPNNQ